jgi:NADH dehydrogenase
VKVLADLSLPDHPNVFVMGDTACAMQDGKPLPGVAPVAMQEANYVASLIEQKVAGKTDSQPFHYRNKGNLATIGRSYGIADFGWLRFGGFVGWFLWLAVHIFFLIGFRNRVIVLFQWALAYLTFQRGARLITFDTSASLKDKELLKELV